MKTWDEKMQKKIQRWSDAQIKANRLLCAVESDLAKKLGYEDNEAMFNDAPDSSDTMIDMGIGEGGYNVTLKHVRMILDDIKRNIAYYKR